MSLPDIVLSSGARTPFGDFGRSLRELPLATLGVHVVKASLARAGLDARQVDHLVFGNTAAVAHDGLFISRKIALNAGLPEDSSASRERAPTCTAAASASATRRALPGCT